MALSNFIIQFKHKVRHDSVSKYIFLFNIILSIQIIKGKIFNLMFKEIEIDRYIDIDSRPVTQNTLSAE